MAKKIFTESKGSKGSKIAKTSKTSKTSKSKESQLVKWVKEVKAHIQTKKAVKTVKKDIKETKKISKPVKSSKKAFTESKATKPAKVIKPVKEVKDIVEVKVISLGGLDTEVVVNNPVRRGRGRPKKVRVDSQNGSSLNVDNVDNDSGVLTGTLASEVLDTRNLKVFKFIGYCPKCQSMLGDGDLINNKVKCIGCIWEGKVEELLLKRKDIDRPKSKKEFLETIAELPSSYVDFDEFPDEIGGIGVIDSGDDSEV